MKRLDIAHISEWGFFTLPRPSTIAGPCSAETEEQVMETALQLKEVGINVFRAGIWKPRTHPGSFEGVGTVGLEWLKRVKKETGLRISTEVAGAKHVFECLKYGMDMVWLGARTTANPFLVQEIAEALKGTDIPVLVKNPVNPDLDLWIGALERLNACGVRKIGVIHRGFSSIEKSVYRNAPHWQVAIELRSRYPELPFFCDPSHMGGDSKYIKEISQRAMDLGLDGLMVESHCNPPAALSDAKQQLTPSELCEMLYALRCRDNATDNADYNRKLTELRTRIDLLDEMLVKLLADRMNASREIGRIKNEHNVAILQSSRWEVVIEKVMSEASSLGLDPEFVKSVFDEIHEASVSEQAKLTVSGSIDA